MICIHPDFGIFRRDTIQQDRAGKSYKRLNIGIFLFFEVAVEFLLIADNMLAGAGNYHGLGFAAYLAHRKLPEVLYNNLGFLCQVVRVKRKEPGYSHRALSLIYIGVFLYFLRELEKGFIGRVILQYIPDKTFLYSLTHGIQVERFRLSIHALLPEHLKRLGLGRGGKSEKA